MHISSLVSLENNTAFWLQFRNPWGRQLQTMQWTSQDWNVKDSLIPSIGLKQYSLTSSGLGFYGELYSPIIHGKIHIHASRYQKKPVNKFKSFKCCCKSHLFIEPPGCGIFCTFPRAWVTATCVSPQACTMIFLTGPFLHQHLAPIIENENTKSPVQGRFAMCFHFFHDTHRVVIIIYQYYLFLQKLNFRIHLLKQSVQLVLHRLLTLHCFR